LDNNKCPAALIECGFITNKNDRAFIGNSENQKKMAEKILRSIEEYFSKDVQVNTNLVQPTITMIRADTVVPGMKNEKITIVADTFRFITKSDTSRIPDNAIYTINGLTVTPEIVNSIEPGKIASINVTKKDGKNQIDLILKTSKDTPPVGTAKPNGAVTFIGYPDDAKGVKAVIGYYIDPKDPKAVIGHPIDPKDNSNMEVTVKGYKVLPLYVVDGKETTKEESSKINPEQIAAVNVLKGEDAAKKYGDKGKFGVVEITLKK
jgi:hypothetical protein